MTAKQKQFRKAIDQWVERLGLKDWALTVTAADIPPEQTGFGDFQIQARCKHRADNRYCLIEVDNTWLKSASKADIERTAFHELMHLVMADLVCCAIGEGAPEDLVDTLDHTVIRRMENVLFGPVGLEDSK